MSSVVQTAERAAEHTRSSLVELGTQALKVVHALGAMETRGVDSLLDRFGLQRRDHALRPVLWFAAGAVTAGAIVFLIAPESGKKLRGRLAQLWEARRTHEAGPPPGIGIPAAVDVQQELAH